MTDRNIILTCKRMHRHEQKSNMKGNMTFIISLLAAWMTKGSQGPYSKLTEINK